MTQGQPALVLLQEVGSESMGGAVGDMQEQKSPTDCRELHVSFQNSTIQPVRVMVDMNYMEIITF